MSAGGQNYVDQTKILSTKLKINKSVLVIMYFSPEVLPGSCPRTRRMYFSPEVLNTLVSTKTSHVLLPGSSWTGSCPRTRHMYFSPEFLPGWMSTTPYDVLLPGSSTTDG